MEKREDLIDGFFLKNRIVGFYLPANSRDNQKFKVDCEPSVNDSFQWLY